MAEEAELRDSPEFNFFTMEAKMWGGGKAGKRGRRQQQQKQQLEKLADKKHCSLKWPTTTATVDGQSQPSVKASEWHTIYCCCSFSFSPGPMPLISVSRSTLH